MRRNRRRVLAFAFGFALVATSVWAVYAVLGASILADEVGEVYGVLNFGGSILAMILQMFGPGLPMLFGPPDPAAAQGWDLAWIAASEFVGALGQGLAYALLGSVTFRWWRRHCSHQRARNE